MVGGEGQDKREIETVRERHFRLLANGCDAN